METVISKDGTKIAYNKTGSGPAVILVGGAFSYRGYAGSLELAERLSADFTVYNYDRRGRGDSTDSPTYSIEREFEDLDAVIQAAGGSACVFGISSGAVLGLKAAGCGLNIRRLALYEPPYRVDTIGTLPPTDFVPHLKTLIAADKRGDAVRYFMTKGMGAPGFVVTMMRVMPGVWPRLKAVANTLPYDAMLLEDHKAGQPLQAQQWVGVTVPTLVLSGEKSVEALRNGAKAMVDVLPNAQPRVLEGLSHTNMDMKVIAPVLVEFFGNSVDAIL